MTSCCVCGRRIHQHQDDAGFYLFIDYQQPPNEIKSCVQVPYVGYSSLPSPVVDPEDRSSSRIIKTPTQTRSDILIRGNLGG